MAWNPSVEFTLMSSVKLGSVKYYLLTSALQHGDGLNVNFCKTVNIN